MTTKNPPSYEEIYADSITVSDSESDMDESPPTPRSKASKAPRKKPGRAPKQADQDLTARQLEKRNARRIRNCNAARRCREKRRDEQAILEEQVAKLNGDNTKIESINGTLRNEIERLKNLIKSCPDTATVQQDNMYNKADMEMEMEQFSDCFMDEQILSPNSFITSLLEQPSTNDGIYGPDLANQWPVDEKVASKVQASTVQHFFPEESEKKVAIVNTTQNCMAAEVGQKIPMTEVLYDQFYSMDPDQMATALM